MRNCLGNLCILFLPLLIFGGLWFFFSLKIGLLFYGLFSIGMYIHITMTTLAIVFSGKEVYTTGDTFWKMLFLFLSCLSFALFYAI